MKKVSLPHKSINSLLSKHTSCQTEQMLKLVSFLTHQATTEYVIINFAHVVRPYVRHKNNHALQRTA